MEEERSVCEEEKEGNGLDYWIGIGSCSCFCCCKYAIVISLPFYLQSFPCWLLLCFVFSILTLVCLVFLFCIYSNLIIFSYLVENDPQSSGVFQFFPL